MANTICDFCLEESRKNYDKNEAIDRLFIELYKKGLAYKMINIYVR